MTRYDLSRLAFHSMTREELRAALRLRQLECRALRRLRWRLALRFYGVAGGIALGVLGAAAVVILIADRVLSGRIWFFVVGGGASTALILAAAGSTSIERGLQAMRADLAWATERLEMHKDSIRVLERHLRRADG